MTQRSFILVLAAALSFPAAASAQNDIASAPLTQIAAPNNGDWTRTVTMTERGGWQMGNSAAPVKLLEYASITCPHCADFREQAGAALRERYVRSGQVSWEYRPYMIFPTDPGIFMLLRCLGPQGFFDTSEHLYADQHSWMGRLQNAPDKRLQAIQGLAPPQQARELVRLTLLDRFFGERGMSAGQVNACLADQSNLDQLGEIVRRANDEDNVTGTPSFFINGRQIEATNWADLEPMLQAALRRVNPTP
jgi:protein-disulfide isomerase